MALSFEASDHYKSKESPWLNLSIHFWIGFPWLGRIADEHGKWL